MSNKFRRRPQVMHELRANQEGWERSCRRHLPEYRELEQWVRTQRTWKKHRDKQWKD